MYGLVNRAIEGLVREKFGDDPWESIRSRAGVEVSGFVAMDQYDDAITYALVGAASEELGLDPGTILEAFGEYWTTYTIEEGYADLLEMMGSNLEEFLDNLDSMHMRITATMPGLVMPSFRREACPDGSSILYYESSRDGLAPMVVGLLRGLAGRFDVDIEVEPLGPDGDGAERFRISDAS